MNIRKVLKVKYWHDGMKVPANTVLVTDNTKLPPQLVEYVDFKPLMYFWGDESNWWLVTTNQIINCTDNYPLKIPLNDIVEILEVKTSGNEYKFVNKSVDCGKVILFLKDGYSKKQFEMLVETKAYFTITDSLNFILFYNKRFQ